MYNNHTFVFMMTPRAALLAAACVLMLGTMIEPTSAARIAQQRRKIVADDDRDGASAASSNSTQASKLCTIVEKDTVEQHGVAFGYKAKSCGIVSCNVFQLLQVHLPRFIKAERVNGQCSCRLRGEVVRGSGDQKRHRDKSLFKVNDKAFDCTWQNCWYRYSQISQIAHRKQRQAEGRSLHNFDMLDSENHWQVSETCPAGDQSYADMKSLGDMMAEGMDEEDAKAVMDMATIDGADEEGNADFADCPSSLTENAKQRNHDHSICIDSKTGAAAPERCCEEFHWCMDSAKSLQQSMQERMVAFTSTCGLGRHDMQGGRQSLQAKLCTSQCQALEPWKPTTQLPKKRCRGDDGIGRSLSKIMRQTDQALSQFSQMESVWADCLNM
eukprot:TRINITY_DN12093_c0_g1_i1.p1 TRINITY_DN12093_c0_g1~~TRINITY_DN12093_c0_g1_i1.p1  ORF type:complete len:398 (-),score=82.99 TRINITY_DN12093_c0_g1_i1:50-1201(-)